MRPRPKNAFDSFRYALDGILHGFRSQRHMRFHFCVAVLALLAGVVYGLKATELLVLTFAISLVIIAELFNTAIEAVVDLVTTTYHPLAKYAKDVAAGAVLIAALNACVVGVLLFLDVEPVQRLISREPTRQVEFQTVIVTVVMLLVLLVIWKVLGNKGTFLHGGVVSGHSAVGFCLCTLILLISPSNPFVAFLAILMALIISQSRVEAGVHTLQEVLIGALMGILLPVVLFRVVPELLRHLTVRAALAG
jgi:diacylglycerol kinase (ATP)